jgi:transcriptional regulator GlxA family with amidase domain
VLFGIFIYPGGEPIDLASFGLLSIAKRIRPEIELCTIAPYGGLTVLSNGLCVLADYGIARAPGLDILVVTGGPGWIDQSRAPETLAFIRRQAAAIPIVPVSTGALIVAASGILDGKVATTERDVVPSELLTLARLRGEWATAYDANLLDTGTTAGGNASLCIDTMLHLLERLFGPEIADETASIIEYWRPRRANRKDFPPLPPLARSQ